MRIHSISISGIQYFCSQIHWRIVTILPNILFNFSLLFLLWAMGNENHMKRWKVMYQIQRESGKYIHTKYSLLQWSLLFAISFDDYDGLWAMGYGICAIQPYRQIVSIAHNWYSIDSLNYQITVFEQWMWYIFSFTVCLFFMLSFSFYLLHFLSFFFIFHLFAILFSFFPLWIMDCGTFRNFMHWNCFVCWFFIFAHSFESFCWSFWICCCRLRF